MSKNDNENRQAFIREIIDSLAYNPASQFIDVDKLWQNHQLSIKVSNLISKLIVAKFGSEKFSSIIAFDNLTYPFGPIPIASHLSTILKIPLTIVKEGADPITGRHKIYGFYPETSSLVFYDVTRFGLTALRMIGFLHSEGIIPQYFITMVDCDQGAIDLLARETSNKLGVNVKFHCLLKLGEIEKAYNKEG